MNNPLAQKYSYYLNESHRLSEELQNEVEYSELLENVLFELLGEEDFTKLFEYVMMGTATKDVYGNPLSKEKSDRRAKRIQQIVNIGRRSRDSGVRQRAAASLVAKGGNTSSEREFTADETHNRVKKVEDALKNKSEIQMSGGRLGDPHDRVRITADLIQKKGSKQRRDNNAGAEDRKRNTFK